jgi:hypothetical protein
VKRHNQYRHGHSPSGRPSREYITWSSMKSRCLNPRHFAYKWYGGRGITICKKWLLFEGFLADMGPRPSSAHSLDRVDTDGNYEPGNCRWATETQQQNNRANNHRLTINGETATLTEWARRTGISRGTLDWRIRHGWTVERALLRLREKK